MTCRDWLATLWPASYKGVPFYVEKDDESGGRRIVVHEFPMRDDPYLEDLGESPRIFAVTAYVVGDAADAAAQGLSAAFVSEGAGLLVLPTHGPVLVRCRDFQRDRSKDKHGYIGFSAKFVREGQGVALLSSTFLGNAVAAAVAAVTEAAATAFAASVAVIDAPDYVGDAVRNGIIDAAAALDAIRTTFPVAPAVSADVRDAVQEIADLAPALVDRATGVTTEYPERIFEATLDMAEGMAADDAARAFATLFDDLAPASPPTFATPAARAAHVNAEETKRVVRLAALSAYADAVARRAFRARPEGISARAEAAERFEEELSRAGGAENAALFVAIQTLRGTVIDYLSRVIVDLAPVVTVETNLSVPSLAMAWRLYADPLRAPEIVARNRVPHPSFLPTRFEALAR